MNRLVEPHRGNHQREVDLLNPSYPDVGDIGAGSPANRYLLDGDLRLQRNSRTSIGVDQRRRTRRVPCAIPNSLIRAIRGCSSPPYARAAVDSACACCPVVSSV